MGKGKPHYFRFFTGDYRRDTPHLTTEEHGAYLLIIMAMFDAGGDLPNDEVLLQRASGVAVARWSRVWKTLQPFFSTLVEGGVNKITQLRIKSEYQLSAKLISKNSDNGKASAEAKRLKALGQSSTSVERAFNDGSTSQSQSQERERERAGKTKESEVSDSDSDSDSESEDKSLRQESEKIKTPPAAADALLDGMPAFGPAAFRVLFGQWPGQDNPKFNERPADAEASFFKHITSDNYASFVHALNSQLLGFAHDHSPTRRKELGTFRTFCEERWTKYKDPAPPPAPNPVSQLVSTVDDAPLMEV